MQSRYPRGLAALLIALAGLAGCAAPHADVTPVHAPAATVSAASLASWNEGRSKAAITDFVTRVTTPGSPDFVPPAERIAVFDNDGTLWAEKPHWPSVLFYFDRLRAMGPSHPEWRDEPVLRNILDTTGYAALDTLNVADVLRIATLVETGVTPEAFRAVARDWLATARHPQTGLLFKDMVYQPMLELLGYLRAHGFKTYISTGAFEELTRELAPVYGIPRDQVIGSRWKLQYQETPEGTRALRLPEVDFYNNTLGKVATLEAFLGQRPLMVVGNSDGDLAMMTYGADRAGPSLSILVDHDDAAREYQYTKGAEKALARAAERNWVTVSVRNDWSLVYPVGR